MKVVSKFDGIPSETHYCTSRIIININDELNPVNLFKDAVKYYCILDGDVEGAKIIK